MPGTFSLQHKLPRLPVPSLEESCALYLKSLLPLQTPEEHARTKKLVVDFVSGELGKSLQQRLVDIDRVSPNNWLEDNFWLRKAYLEWRDPLMVNSNWYMLGVDDAHHPQELLSNNGVREEGRFTAFQIRRAAHLAYRSLEYKEFIQSETLPIDMLKKDQPQCMWQYTRIFGITRVPLPHCDGIIQQDLSKTNHIVVLVQNHVYKLTVYHPDGKRYTVDEIERGLLAIVHHAQNLKEKQENIPLLTSWDRDNWANARNHLLTLDPVNRASLSVIESALFAIALDDYSQGADLGSWTKTALCGKGGRGHNRWFDKSITFVVESNGKCHLSGEHSPCDALTVSWAWDHALKEPCPGPWNPNVIQPDAAAESNAQLLVFKTDTVIDRYIAEAQIAADKTSALSDSYVLIFEEFGTNWVKKTGRLPPDAFYQMVLQIAYYRLHNKVTATYETGSTRKYLRGRTDTIRTCSVDTKQLVENFDNPKLDAKAKYDLLVKATASHRKYTQIASEGRACDRHLMVLRILNADHVMNGNKAPMHPMFEDPIFKESQTWRLSTSGLQAGIRIMGTGFGAAAVDGYGANYMAAPTLVKFGIECKKVPETVTARAFADALKRALLDLKALCEAVNNQQQQGGQQQQHQEQAKI